jgi:hypothetical protein
VVVFLANTCPCPCPCPCPWIYYTKGDQEMMLVNIHGTDQGILVTTLDSLTDEELISVCRDSTDPLISNLIERLTLALDAERELLEMKEESDRQ